MRYIIIALLVIMNSPFSMANPDGENINVRINGMVCAFCAQGITKKFKKIDSVDMVKVDLDAKIVKLGIKKGQNISDETIKEAVTDSGFNLEKIERNPL